MKTLEEYANYFNTNSGNIGANTHPYTAIFDMSNPENEDGCQECSHRASNPYQDNVEDISDRCVKIDGAAHVALEVFKRLQAADHGSWDEFTSSLESYNRPFNFVEIFFGKEVHAEIEKALKRALDERLRKDKTRVKSRLLGAGFTETPRKHFVQFARLSSSPTLLAYWESLSRQIGPNLVLTHFMPEPGREHFPEGRIYFKGTVESINDTEAVYEIVPKLVTAVMLSEAVTMARELV